MAHASDNLASIPKEIQRLKKDVDELKAKINEHEKDPALSALVKEWKQERKNYEAELEVRLELAQGDSLFAIRSMASIVSYSQVR